MKKIIQNVLKVSITLATFFSTLIFSAPSFAAEDSAYAEKARARQYPGGADESDLKVQQAQVSAQKFKPEVNQESNEGF